LKVTVDFLIPPSLDTDKGGDLRHIEKDFAAVITPGLRPLLKEVETKKALEILTLDFFDPDSLGPSRVAQFQYNEPNPDLQADVAGYIRELLDKCSKA
jgi:hypothetical protein